MQIDSRSISRQVVSITIFWLFCAGFVRSQDWNRVDVSDPQQERQYAEFTFPGKFVKAPPVFGDASPMLILRCQPGRYSKGHLHGKLIAAALHVGKVVDGTMVRNDIREELFSAKPDPDGYFVEFSLNDGEMQADHWDSILDYQAVGFGAEELNSILWGQPTPRKEETNPPVKKFVINLQQKQAGQIVIQFDLPDPAVVSEFCGCTYFQKKD